MTLVYAVLAISFAIQVVEFFYLRAQNDRMDSMQEEIDGLKLKQYTNEKKFRKIGQPTDTIEIIYKPDNSGAPKYPHSDGL